MTNSLNQPFFIPFNKRHLFRGISPSGYLPALEPKELEPENQNLELLRITIAQLENELKWKVHRVREINWKFECLENVVMEWLTVINRNKIPVSVVEVPRAKIIALTPPKPSPSVGRQEINKIKAQTNYLMNKINEHLDRTKRKRKDKV